MNQPKMTPAREWKTDPCKCGCHVVFKRNRSCVNCHLEREKKKRELKRLLEK